MKNIINKYNPRPVRQCSRCGAYYRSMIVLNGAYICWGCYNRRYVNEDEVLHL